VEAIARGPSERRNNKNEGGDKIDDMWRASEFGDKVPRGLPPFASIAHLRLSKHRVGVERLPLGEETVEKTTDQFPFQNFA